MREEDLFTTRAIESILASFEPQVQPPPRTQQQTYNNSSNGSSNNNNNLNNNNNQQNLSWIPHQTRSGRIPQRPDPNQPILDPLEFLNFPSDSESDDPDFQPPIELNTTQSHYQPYQRQPTIQPNEASSASASSSSLSTSILIDPALSNSRLDKKSGSKSSRTTGIDNTQTFDSIPKPVSTSQTINSNIYNDSEVGFDFSTLSDSNDDFAWLTARPSLSQSPNRSYLNQPPKKSSLNQPLNKSSLSQPLTKSSLNQPPNRPSPNQKLNRPSTSQSRPAVIEKAIRISDDEDDDEEEEGYNQSDKHSPLTEGALAGIPFVDINLPESEDSPEFIPPPIPLSKRPRRTEPSITRSSLQRQQVENSHRNNNPNHHHPPLQSPPRTKSIAKSIACSPNKKSRLDQAAHRTQSSSSTSSARATLSNRLVEIAPSPVHTSPPPLIKEEGRSAFSDEGESGKKKGKGPGRQQSSGYEGVYVTITDQEYSTSGPKAKPKPQLSAHQKEERLRRKREMMRAVRERKKEYIEELEDKCLALAEENARLKEENEQLIRESRENWRAKALGLNEMNVNNSKHQSNKIRKESGSNFSRELQQSTSSTSSKASTIHNGKSSNNYRSHNHHSHPGF